MQITENRVDNIFDQVFEVASMYPRARDVSITYSGNKIQLWVDHSIEAEFNVTAPQGRVKMDSFSVSVSKTPSKDFYTTQVASDSNPEVTYLLRVYPDSPEKSICTCPSFMYRKDSDDYCKHLKRELH